MERAIGDEALWLLRSIGVGALLGLLYDVKQTLSVPLHRSTRKLWDILFVLSGSIWLFGLCLRCHGEMRLSFFAFMGLGCLCYGLSLRKVAKKHLKKAEGLELALADRVNGAWEKILIFVKKCFSKWINSYTIRRRKAGDGHGREEDGTASYAARSADALTVRTTYSAERVGRKNNSGGSFASGGKERGDPDSAE